MKKQLLLAAAMLVASAGTAQAQITEGWSGEASLSGSKTTGNTDTTDLGLGLKLQKETDVWRHKFKALADTGKVSGENDFGPFKQGYFLGTGVGYKAILPEPLSWNLEGGLGYRSQKSRIVDNDILTNPLGLASDRTNELAVRGFSDLDYVLNENVSLYNDTEIIYSKSDWHRKDRYDYALRHCLYNEVGLVLPHVESPSPHAARKIILVGWKPVRP